MINNNDILRIQKLLDPCIAIISFNKIVIDGYFPWYSNLKTNSVYACIALLIIFIFPKRGLYESYRAKKISSLIRKVTISWILVLAGVQFFLYSLSSGYFVIDLPFVTWALTCYLIFIFCHVVGRKILRIYNRIYGKNIKVLYLGSYDAAIRFKSKLDNCYENNFALKAWFCPELVKEENMKKGELPFIEGGLNELDAWLKENKIDIVVFSHKNKFNHTLEELINFFGDRTTKVYFDPLWVKPSMNIKVSEIADNVCFSLWDRSDSLIDKIIKRIFDIIFSSLAIFLLSPLFLVVVYLIKRDSKGPIIFKQTRYGLNGKNFKIFKFRTMYEIEDDQKDLIQTKKGDPRVTRFGKLMRKWSVDELPQLFNVLLGQMSVVGPRPHVTSHNEYYRKLISGYSQRHMFKPGMTGLAQVNGYRGETIKISDMENRVAYDIKYQKNWSIWIDIKIIFMTIYKIKSENAF
tara:strand:+ start:752 stop:2140 length:1389 start_codon:yes stop_codon:yes gene_type:complete